MTCDITDIPELTTLPEGLWAKHKYDVGLIKSAQPVVITPKSDYRPNKRQFPLSKEQEEDIKPVFKSLMEAGVIVPCNDSPVYSPILPVRKAPVEGEPVSWRFCQDLCCVSDAVLTRVPVVPNPYTILSQITPEC